MARTKQQQLQQQNHPKKGATIKVDPIRDVNAIQRIKHTLKDDPRNLCLFTLGLNTAYRANELLSLTVGQVQHLKAGDTLDIKQSKNQEYRRVTLNNICIETIKSWLIQHPNPSPQAALFTSTRTQSAITVPTLCRLIKKWTRHIGLNGNYGSHSMRKSWGYHQRVRESVPLPILMRAFGHASEEQTLAYLGIQQKEIEGVYLGLEL